MKNAHGPVLCVYGVNLTASIVGDNVLVALMLTPHYFFPVYGNRIAENFLPIFGEKRIIFFQVSFQKFFKQNESD